MFNHLKSIIFKYLGAMGSKKNFENIFQSTKQKRFTVTHKHLNCHTYSSLKS